MTSYVKQRNGQWTGSGTRCPLQQCIIVSINGALGSLPHKHMITDRQAKQRFLSCCQPRASGGSEPRRRDGKAKRQLFKENSAFDPTGEKAFTSSILSGKDLQYYRGLPSSSFVVFQEGRPVYSQRYNMRSQSEWSAPHKDVLCSCCLTFTEHKVTIYW